MMYHPASAPFRKVAPKPSRKILAACWLALSIGFLSLNSTSGQIRIAKTSVAAPASHSMTQCNPIEVVGRIQQLDGRILKVKHNDREKPQVYAVAKEAKITLNRQLATLKELKMNDFVRIETAPKMPGVALTVEATRAIHLVPSTTE